MKNIFAKMWKILKPVICVSLVIALVVTLTGCNKNRELGKVSKSLNSYKITATLCDEEKKINAKEVVDFKNNLKEDLGYVCFNLYGTAFSEDAKVLPYTLLNENKCFPDGKNYGDLVVNSVRVDGANATYEIVGVDNNALKVNFSEPIKLNKKAEIEIEFTLTLAKSTHRLGYTDRTISLGNWYPVLCKFNGEEYDMSPYYSTGDPFYSDCANYEVEFTYPNKYSLASTGEQTKASEDEKSGITTVNYKALAVRDFAMCLSDDWKMSEEKVDGTTVRVFAYNSDEKLGSYLKTAVNCFKFFNSTFGVYPYTELNVVFTPFLHGGMEYPNLVLIADNIIDEINIAKVIIHEIAHQWWYSVVGNNELKDAWIDESLAEYSTIMFFEKHPEYGVTRQQMVKENKDDYLLFIDVMKSVVTSPLHESMELYVNEYSSEYEYVYMIYVKGVLFQDALRNKIGDEAYIKGLSLFYKKNKFKIVTKKEFIEAFEKASGLNLERFIEEWLQGNNTIE